MTSSNSKGKGPNVLGALMDFLILVLLIGGAGFGGYYWGTTQRLAPVQMVPAGTPGAISADKTQVSPPTSNFKPEGTGTKAGPSATSISVTGDTKTAASTTTTPATSTATTPTPTSSSDTKSGQTEAAKKKGPNKYWVVSSGTDYTGYNITVKVNGTPVDAFFGPGKTMNVTHLVKAGENDITFEAKNMGAKYNRHKGDEKAELILQLVSGPVVQEEFDKSAVLATYKRNASETEDFSDTEHFVKE